MYLLLLAVIYIAFISLGLPDSLLGSAWPTIYGSFNVPLSYMGIVTMIISGSTIISGLMSERLTKKFGTGAVTAVSVLMTAAQCSDFQNQRNFIIFACGGFPTVWVQGRLTRRSIIMLRLITIQGI